MQPYIIKKAYSYFFFYIILEMIYYINYIDPIISNFWNIVSFSSLFIMYRLIILDNIFRIGIIFLTGRTLKYLTRNIELCQRPVEAKNFNWFNLGGNQSRGSGFPSGHMTITTFYGLKYVNYPYNYILIFLMGFSRYYKYAHNLFQICAGLLLGSLFRYLT